MFPLGGFFYKPPFEPERHICIYRKASKEPRRNARSGLGPVGPWPPGSGSIRGICLLLLVVFAQAAQLRAVCASIRHSQGLRCRQSPAAAWGPRWAVLENVVGGKCRGVCQEQENGYKLPALLSSCGLPVNPLRRRGDPAVIQQ